MGIFKNATSKSLYIDCAILSHGLVIRSLELDNSFSRIEIRSLELDNPFSRIAIRFFELHISNSRERIAIREKLKPLMLTWLS